MCDGSQVSYEDLRLRNIQRNNAILSALELDSISSLTPQSAIVNGESKQLKKAKQRLFFLFFLCKSFRFLIPVSSLAGGTLATRGSLRIAKSKSESESNQNLVALPDDWQDPETLDLTKKRRKAESDDTKPSPVSRRSTRIVDSSSELSIDGVSAEVKVRSKPIAADSSRNLHASLNILEAVLGRSVPGGHIKAGVMQFVSPDCEPKFSKYTGVQEWQNAIFFMMNIVADNNYENTFLEEDGGMNATYFLSERTKPDAPIIQRIAQRGADRPSLHLFCRATSQGSGSAHAAAAAVALGYVYFGRLQYVRHDAAARPIAFVFRLLDYPAAHKAPDMRALLELAASSG